MKTYKTRNKLTKKFSHFIFDIDGVILNSKINMKFSWNKTNAKLKLKKKFSEYFKNIGLPFPEILKKMNIKNNHKRIEQEYKKNSIKFVKKINLYKNIKEFISHLDSKKIPYYIVTSKDRVRTKKFLYNYKIFPKTIHCPSVKFKGKPRPDLINHCIKINHINKKECCYVGDTEHDYSAATKAKIKFIFASYGYGEKKTKYKFIINKPEQLFKFV
jgi:phosphoglycolate phosphatase